MNKELWFSEIKVELAAKIAHMNLENFDFKRNEIVKILDFVILLKELPINENLPDLKQEELMNNKESELETGLNDDSITFIHETEDRENGSQTHIGRIVTFERKLSGGFIAELEGGYIIPEKMVRDMGAEDGDKLKIVGEKNGYPKNFYWFEITEKGEKKDNNRVEIKFCKVEKEAGELMVRETQTGMIKVDEMPYTYIVDDHTKQNLDIKDGDIVDLAYYKENPFKTMKIAYKYEIHETFASETKEKKILNSQDKMEKQRSGKKSGKDYPVDLTLFENKRILIVGGMYRHGDYKQPLESLGIDYQLMTGNESQERLEAAINKSDVVALLIGDCRHAASIFTVEMCKKKGIPFSSTGGNGIQAVLLCVEEAIKKGMRDEIYDSNWKSIG